MKSIGIIFAFFIFTLQSYAVSRVGGGKIQSSSGFEIQAASQFANFKSYKADSVLALGPVIYQVGQGPIRQFIELSEFGTELPDKVLIPQKEFTQEMLAANWNLLPYQESCVVLFASKTIDSLAYVATWGSGKGFVLKGLKSQDTELAMKEMLATLYIQPGSCSWK